MKFHCKTCNKDFEDEPSFRRPGAMFVRTFHRCGEGRLTPCDAPIRPQPDARVEKALKDYDEGRALDSL